MPRILYALATNRHRHLSLWGYMCLQDNDFQHICQSKISQNEAQKHSEGGFGADLDRLRSKNQKNSKRIFFWGSLLDPILSPFWAWSPSTALCKRNWAMYFRNNFLTRLLVSLRIVPKLQSIVNSRKIAWFAIADLGSKMLHFGTHFDTQIRHYTHFESLEWAFGAIFDASNCGTKKSQIVGLLREVSSTFRGPQLEEGGTTVGFPP